MTQRKGGKRLKFEALRLAIERCDPDLVLGFYADGAHLSIANAGFPQSSPSSFVGKRRSPSTCEWSSARRRRAASRGRSSARSGYVPGGVRVPRRKPRYGRNEAGGAHGGKIVRQVEVVSKDA